MKQLALTITTIGVFAASGHSASALDFFQVARMYSHLNHGRHHVDVPYRVERAHQRELSRRAHQREHIHREAHRYPMTWQQHERLLDQLNHQAYHDHLEHREVHRRKSYYRHAPRCHSSSGFGFGFSSHGLSLWIGH